MTCEKYQRLAYRCAVITLYALMVMMVLASQARAECTEKTFQRIQDKVNEWCVISGEKQTEVPTNADLLNGPYTCYTCAHAKALLVRNEGCRGVVLLGYIKDGQGHAVARAEASDGTWYTLDSRPGTEVVRETMRDFVPVTK